MGIPTQEMLNAHEGRGRESLVYEVEALRARVKELEYQADHAGHLGERRRTRVDVLEAEVRELKDRLLEEQTQHCETLDANGKMGEALAMARHDRDAAIDALHALAEWVDAVKVEVRKELGFWQDPEEDEFWNSFLKTLEGGWDATAGEE